MLAALRLTRARTAVAVAVAALVAGGVVIAWANSSFSPPQLATAVAADQSQSATTQPSAPASTASGASSTPTSDASTGASSVTAPTTAMTTAATGPDTTAPGEGSTPPAPGDEVHSVAAAGAGTVTYAVDGDRLRLIDAVPAAGWRVDIEQAGGHEIDLDFRSGTRRVQVDIEFEDGGVRERVRFRDDTDGNRTETRTTHH